MTVPIVQFVVRGQAEATHSFLDRDYTVVYDGACKVCTKLSHVLLRWDRTKRLEVIPSQTPGLPQRFPWIPAIAYTESLQLVARNGETWQGAAAIEKILDALPKGRFISWIFSIPFARSIAERFYRWFARNRYRLGCGEHCQYRALSVDYEDGDPTGRA